MVRTTAFCFSLFLAGLWAALPVSASEFRPLLERPLSPGSAALLIEHAGDPASQERWAQALRDPRPEVRAATARVINASRTASLVPNLRNALATEQDDDAAGELIRALAVLAGAEEDENLLAAAKRLGKGTDEIVAEALARSRGPGLARDFSRLRGLVLSEAGKRRFVLLATRGEAAHLVPAAAGALRDGDPELWTGLLGLARDTMVSLDPGLLTAALGADSGRIVAEALWHVALTFPNVAEMPAALREAAEAALSRTEGDVEADLGTELVARLLGRKPVERTERIARLLKDPATFRRNSELRHRAAKLLTPAERAALEPKSHSVHTAPGEPKERSRERETSAHASQKRLFRTIADFPKGFVGDVLAVTGCDPRKASDLGSAAEVVFGLDGSPQKVALLDKKPSPCESAARTLLLSTLGLRDRPTRPEAPETLLVPFQTGFLSCLAEDGADDESAPIDASGPIEAPKKIHHIAPTYPSAALRDRRQGVVVLEATIGKTGCVRSVDVLRGVHPALDLEALLAVSGWRYTVTRLNGLPVPVIMTVTANFRLR